MLRDRFYPKRNAAADSALRRVVCEGEMALDVRPGTMTYDAEKKDLYAVGEMPPLGHVPKQMHAWAIRRERHGSPDTAMQVEVVPTWEIGDNDVLVLVMAAGVNYNGVWAALGQPISPFDGHQQPFHIAGSDAAGIVWQVGRNVKRWKVGDEVVIHCNQDDGDDEECNGGDPMFSPTSGSGATRRRTGPSRSSPVCRRSN
jgi:crotonyl-CoA carboxylase/reductase